MGEDARQAVGLSLQEAREAQRRALRGVEGVIEVHAHHIEAPESGDDEALPESSGVGGSGRIRALENVGLAVRQGETP